MKIDELIDNLNDDKLNETLELLEEIIVEKNSDFINRINEIILYPELIKDTNKFALLLSDLKSESFIPNIIKKIKEVYPQRTEWLADYMYSLGSILEDSDIYYDADDSFADMLGDWMLHSDGGELSWKSAIILSNLNNSKVYDYLKKGVIDNSLFHLTRNECLKRLVNEYGAEEIKLIESLLKDKDDYFKEAVQNAIDWIKAE